MVVVIGWWNGFWNLLIFFRKGIVNKFVGIEIIKRMFNNLLGIVWSIWNMGKKYYLGNIFKGVVNGFVGLLIIDGFRIVKFILYVIVFRIIIGKMYKRLLGYVGFL